MKKVINKNLLIIICAMLCLNIAGFLAIFNNPNKVSALESAEIETTSENNYFCLRDTDLLITENQESFGLCWDFSMIKVLESYLGGLTNQVYNFSEAWVAVCNKIENSNYVLGSGGEYITFVNLVKKYGLLLEEDLPYETIYNIDDNNYEKIYNTYKEKAIKAYTNNIGIQSFFGSNVQQIKEYLLNYGALTISYDSKYMVTYDEYPYSFSYTNTQNFNSEEAHSITIIGWDDNITFKDKDGVFHTGVWICLNSWGTGTKQEIVYIAYDDAWVKATIAGIKII